MSGPVIHRNIVQGTPEWFAIRAGLPTASEFECIVKRLKSGGYSDTRRTYMLQLAGERLIGEPPEGFFSIYTERGKRLEPEARDLYAMLAEVEPEQVGFVTNHGAGCSPDSLIGDDGMLEIKTKAPRDLIDAILKDEFHPAHVAQCQGALWVCEREWIDLLIYWPGLPPFPKRAYRDDAYIANLASEVAAFNAELAEIVEKVRAYGQAPKAEAA
jgi:hypothetical protein